MLASQLGTLLLENLPQMLLVHREDHFNVVVLQLILAKFELVDFCAIEEGPDLLLD